MVKDGYGFFPYSGFLTDNNKILILAYTDKPKVSHTSPEEHIVKMHGQVYHYKDGSVRWKEKDAYYRGKND